MQLFLKSQIGLARARLSTSTKKRIRFIRVQLYNQLYLLFIQILEYLTSIKLILPLPKLRSRNQLKPVIFILKKNLTISKIVDLMIQMWEESVKNINLILGQIDSKGITLNSGILHSINPFTYQLLFKPSDQQQITIQSNIQPCLQGLTISIPITEQNAQEIMTESYSIFLILFAKTVTIARSSFMKSILVRVFSDWQIPVQWKKGPNYLKAILPGTARICCHDFNALEVLLLRGDQLNKKQLAEIKTKNAYFYCKQKFENAILSQIMKRSQEDIETFYEECLKQLSIMYSNLSGSDRIGNVGKKYKNISWPHLQEQITNKILTINSDHTEFYPQSSIDSAIEDTISSILNEEYTNQLQAWPHQTLSQQFYAKVASEVCSSLDLNKKALYFIEIFTNRILEDFGMNGPQIKHKRIIKTQYAFNKEVKKIMKNVCLIEKKHVLEKENLFNIIREKQEQLQFLRRKCNQFEEAQLTTREEENKINKEKRYLDNKIAQLKKQTLFEIKEQIQEEKKNQEAEIKQIVLDNKPPPLSLQRKSLSEKYLIRTSQTSKNGLQVKKMNFIEKNKKVQKTLNKSQQSKENIVYEKLGQKNEKNAEKINKKSEGHQVVLKGACR